MKLILSTLRRLLPVSMLVGFASVAPAASYTWNKAQVYPPTTYNYRWTEAANWDSAGGGVPGAGDTANINIALTSEVQITFFGNPSVGILNIGDASGANRRLYFTPGGTFDFLTFNNNGSEARMNKTSGNTVEFRRSVSFTSDTVFSIAQGAVLFSQQYAFISGNGNLAIEGAGVVEFATTAADRPSMSSAFGGNLTLRSGGTLLVNTNLGAHTSISGKVVTVQSTARLAGSGTVGRLTTVENGGILTPGATLTNAGILTFSDGLKLNAGSQFQFELRGDTVTNRGTSFDGVNVSGGALTIEDGAIFNLTFDGAGSTVNFTTSFWDTEQEWLIFNNTATPTVGAFALGTISVDSQGNEFGVTGGAFGFKQVGNDIYLTYATVPEPGSAALLFGGVTAVFLCWKARKRG